MSEATYTHQNFIGASTFKRLSLVVVLMLIGTVGSFLFLINIQGAVMARGKIEVEASRQVIQHKDGGSIVELNVREGDFVKKGGILARLDPDDIRLELASQESQLAELMARKDRLSAEIMGADHIEFQAELKSMVEDNLELQTILDGQENLFEIRKLNFESESQRLKEERQQLLAQKKGLEKLIISYNNQLVIVQDDLDSQSQLLAKKLVKQSVVGGIEREVEDLQSQILRNETDLAEVNLKILDIEREDERLVQKRQEEVLNEERDIEINEFGTRNNVSSLRTKLEQTVIIASETGNIYQLAFKTPGAVLKPGDIFGYIVPEDATFIISAPVQANDIDQVYIGQGVQVNFSTLNTRTTPKLDGAVIQRSADVISDERTGAQFYNVYVKIDDAELEKLDEQPITPGLPVEVYIQTTPRTPFTYLSRSMTQFFDKSMRE